jgi:putative hydrolase of the HAD superfamily
VGKLSAIFFDIDDTLYSTTAFANLARQRAVEAMVHNGLRLPASVVRRELDEVISEFSSNYPNHFDKLLLRLPRDSWSGTNKALIIASGVRHYHATKDELAPFPDVLPFFKQVSTSDLLLGIITHGLEIKQAEKLLLLGVVPYLNPRAIFISDQLGISKPNPKLYTRACSTIGVDPHEAMYVGDNPLHDVDPPHSIGMTTVRTLRDCKHKDAKGKVEPDYTIESFEELLPILTTDFDVQLGA